jgi:ABC-type spermidine/putrescine transport system permease subunit I
LAYHRINPKYNKEYLVLAAQRLAAQPLGRFRYVVTILAGILKSQSSVLTLSLGQVGCSRGLGGVDF